MNNSASIRKTIDGQKYFAWGHSENGRKIFVAAGVAHKQLELLEKRINSCFHHRTLYNKLKTLKNGSSVLKSQSHSSHTGGRQYCSMVLVGSEVEYFLMDTQVHITKVVLKDTQYEQDRQNKLAPGAYRVTKGDERWAIGKACDKVATLHASINGEVESLGEVLQFIPKMIETGYKSKGEITGAGKLKGFTHLYMPGRNDKHYGWRNMVETTPARGSKAMKAARTALIDRTAACVEIAAQAKHAVKWTVQGSGSQIFCDAVEQVLKRNRDLDLSNQEAYFFNPHTDPMRIKTVVGSAMADQGYASASRSPGNLAAMAKGHGRYTKNKLAEERAKEPGKKQWGGKQDQRKVQKMALGAKGMVVSIASLGATAMGLANNPQLINTAINGAVSAGEGYVNLWGSDPFVAAGATALAAIGAYKSAAFTTPKMIALTHLGYAAIRNNRRLDQLTETNPVKAYDQFRDLGRGLSI